MTNLGTVHLLFFALWSVSGRIWPIVSPGHHFCPSRLSIPTPNAKPQSLLEQPLFHSSGHKGALGPPVSGPALTPVYTLTWTPPRPSC